VREGWPETVRVTRLTLALAAFVALSLRRSVSTLRLCLNVDNSASASAVMEALAFSSLAMASSRAATTAVLNWPSYVPCHFFSLSSRFCSSWPMRAVRRASCALTLRWNNTSLSASTAARCWARAA
jgi:hypothetical protein